MRPADGEHLPVAESGCDLPHAQAPVVRAFEVTHTLARVDHEAAHGLDRVGVGHLPAHRRCSCRIELLHPFVHLTDADERKALECEGLHLEVDDAGELREFARLDRSAERRFGIVMGEQREVRPDVWDESGRRRWRPVAHEHRRPLRPAERFRRAVERERVVGELDGDQGRGVVVAAGARSLESTFMCADGRARVELVAGGYSETEERVDGLVELDRELEGRARLIPGALCERGAAGMDQLSGRSVRD